MESVVRGWIRPKSGVVRFLEEYSRHGGTHHSALVLGNRLEGLLAFANHAGLKPVVIK